jgi:hypothetical protein
MLASRLFAGKLKPAGCLLGNVSQPVVCLEIKAKRLFPGNFKPACCLLGNLSQSVVCWEI